MENRMMIKCLISTRCYFLMILALTLVLFAPQSYAGDKITSDSPNSFYTLIDALIKASPLLDKATVERLTGTKLLAITGNEGAYIAYRSQNRKLNDITIGLVDYREPIVGGGSTVGPFLVLHFKDNCFNLDDIKAHYGPLNIIYSVPYHSVTYARAEHWGKILFNFPATSPKCLDGVVINIEAPIKITYPNTFYDLVDALIKASPALDRATIEQLIGTKSRFVHNYGDKVMYESIGIGIPRLEDITLRNFQYWEAIKGHAAKNASVLYIEFAESCFKYDDIAARYGPLKLDQSSDKFLKSYVQEETWGKLSFGFSPECLTYMMINIKAPPQR